MYKVLALNGFSNQDKKLLSKEINDLTESKDYAISILDRMDKEEESFSPGRPRFTYFGKNKNNDAIVEVWKYG